MSHSVLVNAHLLAAVNQPTETRKLKPKQENWFFLIIPRLERRSWNREGGNEMEHDSETLRKNHRVFDFSSYQAEIRGRDAMKQITLQTKRSIAC